jgi:hypothetical protein
VAAHRDDPLGAELPGGKHACPGRATMTVPSRVPSRAMPSVT